MIEASQRFNTAAQRLPTLFDLEAQAYELLAYLDEWHDLEPEDIAEGQAQLALIDQMMLEKVESYVSVIRSLDAMADAREAEEHRMRDRKLSARKQAEWLKNRLLVHMQTTGRQRIEMARFTVSVKTNPPSVNVLDAAAVPGEFQRTRIEVSVDKRGILDALRATGEIPAGVEIVRTESLRIA